METKTRGRHRAAGKHAARQITIEDTVAKKPPTGRRSVVKNPVVVVPPKPDREPTVGTETGTWSWEPPTEAKPKTSMIQIARHKKPLTALAAIATGGLLVVTGGMSTASVPHAKYRASATTPSDLEYEGNAITVPDDVVIQAEKVIVRTEAAPPPPPPPAPAPEPEPVVIEAPAVVQTPVTAPQVVAKPAGVSAPIAPAPAPEPIVEPAPAPAPIASSGKGAIIAQAAINQIGRSQDCTALVSNSLAGAGMNVPRRWPWLYASLGTNVGIANAQPGDLLIYSAQQGLPAHVGVYIGNGRAVHGGWNGNQTVEWSASIGYPAFGPYAVIRVA